jgi:phospholipid/cholesterol/gamma-HCH transport system substrate-binding protein
METRSNHIFVGGVVLALLAGLVAFTIWLAGLGGGATKEYDIFFKQSVEGLSRGGSVSFSGVPSGTIKAIELWKPNPEFVRVRIAVNEEIPVLVGTTASIQGSFTGASSLLLDGAVHGAPPITEPGPGPAHVPVIPTQRSGLGALLNSAPQLLERLSGLTERLTEILNDRNQKSFGNILANTDRLTGSLAHSGPDIQAAIAQSKITLKQAGDAVAAISQLASSTNSLVNEEGRPMVADLRRTVTSAQKSLASLDMVLTEARPGIHALSNDTLPEVTQLIRELRTMSDSLGSVAAKLDQGGAGALLGGSSLPDYKPGRGAK